MSEKTIVITGASDGIGAAAARQLSAQGHRVVIVGRSAEKTERIARELDAPFLVADFSDLLKVRELAMALRARYGRIDVLANNAGGIFGDRTRTRDGFEKTFQVNHLAPFLLTNLLLEVLLESGATVINTSSCAARLWGQVDLEDLHNDRRYGTRKAYGDSKLENVLFTKELNRRFGERGLAAVAFHPGFVATNFGSESKNWVRFAYHTPIRRLIGMITPEQGAIDLVWLAATPPGAEWVPGEFYAHHRVARTNPQAYDAELARRLWERSAELVGLATTNPRP